MMVFLLIFERLGQFTVILHFIDIIDSCDGAGPYHTVSVPVQLAGKVTGNYIPG